MWIYLPVSGKFTTLSVNTVIILVHMSTYSTYEQSSEESVGMYMLIGKIGPIVSVDVNSTHTIKAHNNQQQ